MVSLRWKSVARSAQSYGQTGLAYGPALAYAHTCAHCLNEKQLNITLANLPNLNLLPKICNKL